MLPTLLGLPSPDTVACVLVYTMTDAGFLELTERGLDWAVIEAVEGSVWRCIGSMGPFSVLLPGPFHVSISSSSMGVTALLKSPLPRCFQNRHNKRMELTTKRKPMTEKMVDNVIMSVRLSSPLWLAVSSISWSAGLDSGCIEVGVVANEVEVLLKGEEETALLIASNELETESGVGFNVLEPGTRLVTVVSIAICWVIPSKRTALPGGLAVITAVVSHGGGAVGRPYPRYKSQHEDMVGPMVVVFMSVVLLFCCYACFCIELYPYKRAQTRLRPLPGWGGALLWS